MNNVQKEDSPQVFLDWLPEFDLGVPEIDSQHRGLRDLVNLVAAAIMAGDSAAASSAIDLLQTCSTRHFDFEESLMQRLDYPGSDLHHEQHSELLASMERLRAEVDTGRFASNRTRALHFLRDWFAIHIVRTDADFVRFLKAGAAEPVLA